VVKDKAMRTESTPSDARQVFCLLDGRSGGLPTPPRSSSIREPEPDPEVCADKPTRRRFSADYKKRILDAVDACCEPGQIGQLLRREGLYASHLLAWRKQRDAGAMQGLAPKKRGRKPKTVSSLATKVARLERENLLLEERLRKAETIIEIQKKVSQLLGLPERNPHKDNSSS